jgi:uncharacterized membrane protein YkvA (DUF1232 family)
MKEEKEQFTNYYQVLEVDPTASLEEIRRAYRDKLKQWHPDRNAHRIEAAEAFTKVLNQAYAVLKDPQSRRRYDRMRRYTDGKNYDGVLNEAEFWQKVEKASPALRRILASVKDLYTLFRDSVRGNYDLHPVTVGVIGAGLLYFIMPLDLVPDYIPLVGLLDDVVVLTTIINSLQDELSQYRSWKKQQC